MLTQSHELRGTEYELVSTVTYLGLLEANHLISTTWILNRDLIPHKLDESIKEIIVFCKKYNLLVLENDSHHLKVDGTSINFSNALQITINKYQNDDDIYHASMDTIKIPIQFKDIIENILGLNTQKVAHPYFKKLDTINTPRASTVFTPLQLATLYNFPTNLDGIGQKIGIIELGGGYVLSDITTYFSMLNLQYTPKITSVSVDGAINNPNDGTGSNVEVILDIEIIAALVPNASIFVYFAPNTAQGFYDAINTAINNSCSIISISWGGPENSWSLSTLSVYNSLFQSASTKNVTILAASGDNGSSDGTIGNNVDFPSSSPYILGCGGTNLKTLDNVTISQETVWNNNSISSATGGGISAVFAEPSYQFNVTYPLNNRRGVPDVSGDADPNTGYVVYSAREGGTFIVGGTSAVSPLWSGLLGRINQSIGHPVGFLHPIIYSHPNVCRDITQGNNGAYSAGPGWDPCTGNGSPNGQALLNLLSNNPPTVPVAAFTASPLSGTAPLTVQFVDQSTGSPTAWYWDFSTGPTSTVQNPSHTFTTAGSYSVGLVVSNVNGTSTLTKINYITVTTAPAPVAAFTGSPLSGTAPLTVQFIDQSTGSPTAWYWDFSNGTTSTSQNPSTVFNTPGSYSIGLVVANANGKNTLTKVNYITVTASPAPVAAFTCSPLSGTTPLTVQFIDQSTGSPTAWYWDFSSGPTSTVQNPSHTFTTPGSYSIGLVVANANGKNTLTKINYITVTTNPAPIAAFTGSPLSGTAPLTVQFIDQSTGSPTDWYWDFSNGITSTSQNPSTVFQTLGLYSIGLVVANANGKNTLTKVNYISVN